MIKMLAIGVWACCVALGTTYVTAMMSSGSPVAVESAPKLAGLEYRRPAPITVPIITDGRLRGYVVTRVVFTAEAQALAEFPIEPEPFIVDEAFRRIYSEEKIEFDQLSRYDLELLTVAIRDNVNERLGLELVQNVLLDELSYIDKKSMDAAEETVASRS